jgi:hypothetical protein
MNASLQTIIFGLMASYSGFVLPHLVSMTEAKRILGPMQNLFVEREPV